MSLSKRDPQVLSAASVAGMGLGRYADADAATALWTDAQDMVDAAKLQGGDMVRLGGRQYTCTPGEKMGSRIGDMRLGGKPIEADKSCKVAGWAPVAEEARSLPGVKPVWGVVETWLKAQGGRVKPRHINTPRLLGVDGNPGRVA